MKLWEAKLELYYVDDELRSKFTIEETKEEYKTIDENRWAKVKHDYLDSTLSKDIQLRKMYGNYTLKQGFDKEPTDIENKQIEETMQLYLKDVLEYEKQDMVDIYNERLKVLLDK